MLHHPSFRYILGIALLLMITTHESISFSFIQKDMCFTIIQSKKCNMIHRGYIDAIRRRIPLHATNGGKENKSLLEVIDEAGQRLKPMAIEAKLKSAEFAMGFDTSSNNKMARTKRILYTLQSCAFFSLFILYRAYRGFFVLLPAVFRQSYQKLTKAVDSPFAVENNTALDIAVTNDQDINPSTGQVRLRTRIVVSVLAAVVVVSYVIHGAFQVLTRFLATVTHTSSVQNSFEAAADEILKNEDKLRQYTVKNSKVNGDDTSRLAP